MMAKIDKTQDNSQSKGWSRMDEMIRYVVLKPQNAKAKLNKETKNNVVFICNDRYYTEDMVYRL